MMNTYFVILYLRTKQSSSTGPDFTGVRPENSALYKWNNGGMIEDFSPDVENMCTCVITKCALLKRYKLASEKAEKLVLCRE